VKRKDAEKLGNKLDSAEEDPVWQLLYFLVALSFLALRCRQHNSDERLEAHLNCLVFGSRLLRLRISIRNFPPHILAFEVNPYYDDDVRYAFLLS